MTVLTRAGRPAAAGAVAVARAARRQTPPPLRHGGGVLRRCSTPSRPGWCCTGPSNNFWHLVKVVAGRAREGDATARPAASGGRACRWSRSDIRPASAGGRCKGARGRWSSRDPCWSRVGGRSYFGRDQRESLPNPRRSVFALSVTSVMWPVAASGRSVRLMAGTAPKTMPSPCRARCPARGPAVAARADPERARRHLTAVAVLTTRVRYSSNTRRPGAPRTARRPRTVGSHRHSGSARSRCSRGSRSAWRCPQARQTLACSLAAERVQMAPRTLADPVAHVRVAVLVDEAARACARLHLVRAAVAGRVARPRSRPAALIGGQRAGARAVRDAARQQRHRRGRAAVVGERSQGERGGADVRVRGGLVNAQLASTLKLPPRRSRHVPPPDEHRAHRADRRGSCSSVWPFRTRCS